MDWLWWFLTYEVPVWLWVCSWSAWASLYGFTKAALWDGRARKAVQRFRAACDRLGVKPPGGVLTVKGTVKDMGVLLRDWRDGYRGPR